MWLAIEVETLAKMYVHALAIGEPPRLTDKDMTRVMEQITRMGYGQAPDLDDVKDTPITKDEKPTLVAKAEPVEAPLLTSRDQFKAIAKIGLARRK